MEDEGDELLRNKNNDSGLTNVTKAKIETRNSNPASSGLPPLPPDWSMQRLPNSGRILFVDNGNQVTTWIDPRTGNLQMERLRKSWDFLWNLHLHHCP